MTEFLSDRSIIPDDSSTLPFPYYFRDNICKLAKFIQSDDDIPSEKYMQENLIQCGLVNDSTLDKVGLSIGNVHMKPDGTKYMTCDRYRGKSEYKKLTSLDIICAGKHEYLVKIERSLIMSGRIAGTVSNRHGDTPKGVQEPSLNSRKGYGVLYLAHFENDKNELNNVARRNCPVAPADSSSAILMNELNKNNIAQTSICFICGVAYDENSSIHGIKHAQTSFTSICDFTRLGFISYEELMLNVLGAYKKKYKVESLITHLESQDKRYRSYYQLSQSLNFLGCVFVDPDAAMIHRRGYESSTMAIVEDKIFKRKLGQAPVLRQQFFLQFFKSIEFKNILMNIIAHNSTE